ncbi:MAG: hypothetical protein HY000_24900 [Planctomycetes bacterium]|nr:hypothetical protein [Planctomycetota bacterium]
MIRIMLDQASVEKLDSVQQGAELCAPSGRVMGYYVPITPASLYREVQCPYTEEELLRFASEPGGRPLSEILADLEKMG